MKHLKFSSIVKHALNAFDNTVFHHRHVPSFWPVFLYIVGSGVGHNKISYPLAHSQNFVRAHSSFITFRTLLA